MLRLNAKFTRRIGWALVALFLVSAALSAQTSLNAQLSLRPVTRDDISAFKLASTTQVSAGVSTIGLGQPAYLEVLVNKDIPASQIAGVTWTLTAKPASSQAVLADSPLGNNVLPYEPSDQTVLQVAGRKLLKPDVVGKYTVTATVTTVSAGSATLKVDITGGTYLGAKTCSVCHSGAIRGDKATPWSKTGHASIFKDGMNGVASDHYGQGCLPCHTVGYDAAPGVDNHGFSQVAAQMKWTFPTELKMGTYDALPDALKNLGNIQCENCHGPGSQHATTGDKTAISVNMASGDCSQCHAAMTHHSKTGEWNNSRHAIATSYPSGAGREACVGCHTGNGFVAQMKGATPSTAYSPINCTTCHEPHGDQTGAGNHLVRPTKVTLADGTSITAGGKGLLCMNCHQARVNASTYVPTTPGSARFGPHHGPQADMLAGVNAVTYGKDIPSSAHGDVVEDTCVTCHMQAVAETDAAFTQAGGHTFKTSMAATANTPAIDLVKACQGCHGKDVKDFNFPLFDYDGDGVIEGVQTEVQHLLDQLGAMLPPQGTVKTELAIDATWTPQQLQAAYNWLYVQSDGSKGIHNTAYTVGLLKSSIADLSTKK